LLFVELATNFIYHASGILATALFKTASFFDRIERITGIKNQCSSTGCRNKNPVDTDLLSQHPAPFAEVFQSDNSPESADWANSRPVL
jgi:hypothetical protein